MTEFPNPCFEGLKPELQMEADYRLNRKPGRLPVPRLPAIPARRCAGSVDGCRPSSGQSEPGGKCGCSARHFCMTVLMPMGSSAVLCWQGPTSNDLRLLCSMWHMEQVTLQSQHVHGLESERKLSNCELELDRHGTVMACFCCWTHQLSLPR